MGKSRHHQPSIIHHQSSTINRIVEVRIEQSWKEVLADEFEKPYFSLLASFIRKEYQETEVYPPGSKIFSAFDLTPFRDVKVVILGQDPYHEPGQAHGLAFSVQPGVQIPPSLQNIYKEIVDDVHSPYPNSGFLERWAKQGVLLLNNVLTVRRAAPLSHQGKGWEEFTDRVVELLSSKRENLVFMLWGSQAQRKGLVIDTKKHLVLKAPHPSPLSAYRGFFGCKHFLLSGLGKNCSNHKCGCNTHLCWWLDWKGQWQYWNRKHLIGVFLRNQKIRYP